MNRQQFGLGIIVLLVGVGLAWQLGWSDACRGEPPSESRGERVVDAAGTGDSDGAAVEEESLSDVRRASDPDRDGGSGGATSDVAESREAEPDVASETAGSTAASESEGSGSGSDAAGVLQPEQRAERGSSDAGSRTARNEAGGSGTSTEGTTGEQARGDTGLEDLDPEEMGPRDVARRVQNFYDQTRDFRAEFRQVYTDVAAGEKKRRHGKLYLKKPGNMRWDYYDGAQLDNRKKTLVSNGEILWVYELEFSQVFKKCLRNSQLPTSLTFLMGQGNLLREFEVSFTGDDPDGGWALELKPREATAKYSKIHLRVDEETFRVGRTTVFDPYGNTNAVEFRNVAINPGLPASGFSFTPPDDARVLNREKSCD